MSSRMIAIWTKMLDCNRNLNKKNNEIDNKMKDYNNHYDGFGNIISTHFIFLIC